MEALIIPVVLLYYKMVNGPIPLPVLSIAALAMYACAPFVDAEHFPAVPFGNVFFAMFFVPFDLFCSFNLNIKDRSRLQFFHMLCAVDDIGPYSSWERTVHHSIGIAFCSAYWFLYITAILYAPWFSAFTLLLLDFPLAPIAVEFAYRRVKLWIEQKTSATTPEAVDLEPPNCPLAQQTKPVEIK